MGLADGLFGLLILPGLRWTPNERLVIAVFTTCGATSSCNDARQITAQAESVKSSAMGTISAKDSFAPTFTRRPAACCIIPSSSYCALGGINASPIVGGFLQGPLCRCTAYLPQGFRPSFLYGLYSRG